MADHVSSGDILIDREYYQFAINYLSNSSHIKYIYADIELNHKYMGKQIVRPSCKSGKTPFPHPSLIVKKSIFNKIGSFDLTLKIAMDWKYQKRKHRQYERQQSIHHRKYLNFLKCIGSPAFLKYTQNVEGLKDLKY